MPELGLAHPQNALAERLQLGLALTVGSWASGSSCHSAPSTSTISRSSGQRRSG
jgi:hypothetical protein